MKFCNNIVTDLEELSEIIDLCKVVIILKNYQNLE